MSYYDGIKLPKPLKKEEIYALYEKMQNGDQNARNEVIEHNIRLVLKIVKKYEKYDNSSSDLESIGIIGLIKGVDTFDISKNFSFATYASRCIENEILMHFRKEKNHTKDVNLEDIIGKDQDGNKLTIENILEDENAQTDMQFSENQEILNALQDFISMLPALERKIIGQRYDFKNNIILTQQEIAEKIGISKSYVSRIEQSAIEKLRILLRDSNTLELRNQLFIKKKKNTAKNATKRKRDYTTFYTYFFEYEKETLDEMLKDVTDLNRQTIYAIWGKNLDTFNEKALTSKEKARLQTNVSMNFKKMNEKKQQQETNIYANTKEKINPCNSGSIQTLDTPIKKTTVKRDYTTFYTYFGKYSKEIMGEVLEKTNEKYRQTIYAIWGENLDQYNKEALTSETKLYLSRSITRVFEKQARKLVEKQNNVYVDKRLKRDYTTFYTYFKNYEKEILDEVLNDINADYRKTIYSIWGETLEELNACVLTPETKILLRKSICLMIERKAEKLKQKKAGIYVEKKRKKDYTTFYTYFGDYSKEVLDEVLEKAYEEYKKTIYSIWGENLDEFNEKVLTPEIKKYLINNIHTNFGQQAKILTAKKNKTHIDKRKKRDYTTFYTYFGKYSKEIMDDVLEQTTKNNKEIVKKIWGENLDEFNEKALTPKMKRCLTNSLTGNLEKKADNLIAKKNKTFVDKRVKRDYTSFYTYFGEYDKKTLDEIFKRMNQTYKNKVLDIWGEDLEHYCKNLSSTDKRYLCHNVRTSVESIAKTLQANGKTNEEAVMFSETLEDKEQEIKLDTRKNEEEIKKEDYVSIANRFKTDSFQELMKKVGSKEAFIVSLKLGQIGDKYYSNEAIANFLEISEEEVIATTKNILIQYKHQVLTEVSKKMDQEIEAVVKNKIQIKTE